MLDPFKPESEEDVARLKGMLEKIHTNFIRHVQKRRGDKLDKGSDLFTGDIWIGDAAKDVGLIDGIAHLVPAMKARFGDKVTFRRYGPKRSWMSRIGAQVATDALAGIEERAEFARYGL